MEMRGDTELIGRGRGPGEAYPPPDNTATYLAVAGALLALLALGYALFRIIRRRKYNLLT